MQPPRVPSVPVLKGHLKDNKANFTQVYGTAFYLGHGMFMTASHALEPPESPEFLHIAIFSEYDAAASLWKNLLGCPITKTELHKEFDIGIAQVAEDVTALFPHVARPDWTFRKLSPLEDVIAPGYPFALDSVEYDWLTARAHKGYIVSTIPYRRVNEVFRIYELSFPIPKGMSGAPLSTDGWGVGGVVIGTRRTSIVLEYENEVTSDGKTTDHHHREEIIHYGVAVPSYVLATIQSEMLGTTVGDYLRKEGIVRDARTHP